MGIDTGFLDELCKIIASAFQRELPENYKADCVIFDGTQELQAFLMSGSTKKYDNGSGLVNQKIYSQFEHYNKTKWTTLLSETKAFHEISCLICLLDVDRKTPINKNLVRLANRKYKAYNVAGLIRLGMLQGQVDFMKSRGYSPKYNDNDTMDVDQNNNKIEPSPTDEENLIFKPELLNDYMYGDPNEVWATRPFRDILKNKYCEIMIKIFGDASVLNIPAVNRLNQKRITRLNEMPVEVKEDKDGDDNLQIKERYAMQEIGVRHGVPIFLLDGVSRKQADPNIVLSSVENMEESLKTSQFKLKSSSSSINKGTSISYLDDPSLSIHKQLYISELTSINASGVFRAPFGYKFTADNNNQTAIDYSSYFSLNELYTPGEADIKVLNYIHPDFGNKFVVRTDDTDFIPILLARIQKWVSTNASGDGLVPEIWLDRTCNAILRENKDNVKRYINVTAIWDYYVRKNKIPIERLILVFLLKKTDYVIPFDDLNDGIIPGVRNNTASAFDAQDQMVEKELEDGSTKVIRPKIFLYGVAKLMGFDVFGNHKFIRCPSVKTWGSTLDSIVHCNINEHALADFLFSRYRTAIHKAADGDDAYQKTVSNTVNMEKLHADLADYNIKNNKKILLSIPTNAQLKANIRRILWNFNYWINGNINARNKLDYENVASPALECVRRINHTNSYTSQFGWDLEEVPDNELNPLDITQISLPIAFPDKSLHKRRGTGALYEMHTNRRMYRVVLSNQIAPQISIHDSNHV